MTCSAIWGLLDKDDDLRVSHELLNTEEFCRYSKYVLRYDFLNVTGSMSFSDLELSFWFELTYFEAVFWKM